jgi:hypothetical protein
MEVPTIWDRPIQIPALPPATPVSPVTRLLTAWIALLSSSLVVSSTAAETPANNLVTSFEKEVRPILKAACFHCHGESDQREGGLDVRLARLIKAGGESGPAIIPGSADESLLWQRVRDGDMPPDPSHRLSQTQIDSIRRWIAAGADTDKPEPEAVAGMLITDAERAHWSFQPIQRPDVPAVHDPAQVKTPIDAFLLSKLEEHGLGFSPPADRRRLLRRMAIDLHGLPPAPEQVDHFFHAEGPAAYQRCVDQFLASPRYGERWGRHWLDIAGYADSEGYNIADAKRPHAWRYRDYVVDAWNQDTPLDRFIVEQLAGDELVSSPLTNLTPEDARLLIATGYLRMAPDGTGGSVDDANVARNDVIADTIKIVTSSLLGLTVGCAQCHDHRYDPIPQSDYYQIRAVFDPALDWKRWRKPSQRLVSLYTDRDRQQAAAIEEEAKVVDQERSEKQSKFIAGTLEKEFAKLPEAIRTAAREAHQTPADDRSDEQKKLLKQHPSLNVSAGSLYLYDRQAAAELKALADQAAAIRSKKPPQRLVRATTETPDPIPESRLFVRGDHEQPGAQVEPSGLTVVSLNTRLPEIPVSDSSRSTSGRRLALAVRLTDPQHPLLARVLVNRVWMHHFGRGLVATPSDFGVLGARPTHPLLLDWLAAELIDSGWSIKHLHRLIMNSTAYRQSLRVDPVHNEVDPENLLYGGARLRRLDAESFRDSVLAVCGTMDHQLGGPPIPVMADSVGRWILGVENIKDGRAGSTVELGAKQFRRSLYVEVRRSRPLSVLESFDWPTMTPNCEIRRDSTVATQSLMLINSDLMIQCAGELAARVRRELAARVRRDVAEDADCAIMRLWKIVYGRDPSTNEQHNASEFLAGQTRQFQQQRDDAGSDVELSPPQLALTVLCQMLLCSNEFLYVD